MFVCLGVLLFLSGLELFCAGILTTNCVSKGARSVTPWRGILVVSVYSGSAQYVPGV